MKCPVCGETFKSFQLLKSHAALRHSSLASGKCPVCGLHSRRLLNHYIQTYRSTGCLQHLVLWSLLSSRKSTQITGEARKNLNNKAYQTVKEGEAYETV